MGVGARAGAIGVGAAAILCAAPAQARQDAIADPPEPLPRAAER